MMWPMPLPLRQTNHLYDLGGAVTPSLHLNPNLQWNNQKVTPQFGGKVLIYVWRLDTQIFANTP